MTTRSVKLFSRIGALIVLAWLINACAPLSQDELNRMARDSSSIRPLAESLARADGGSTLSLDDDRFLAEISRATLSRQQFLSVLSTHCQSAHGGTIKTSRDNFPLGGKDIRDFQLQSMAGSGGPITDYLRDTLGRTLNSDVSKAKRELSYDGSERYGDKLHRQATVLCTSYGDNGLLQLHYMVSYLTTDADGGGNPVWGVAAEGAFTPLLERQRELALAAASRKMSEDQETIVAYRGVGQNGMVSVAASVERPAPYGYEFEVQLQLKNQGASPVTVDAQLDQVRTADGKDWTVLYDGPVRNADNTCESINRRQIRVASGEACQYRFLTVIQGFEMPNMVMNGRVAEAFVKLSPVSQYQSRQARH